MLDANRWRDQDFACLSFRHRAFLIVLECLADKAGVVDWELEKINDVAGDGADFSRVDVKQLGSDNAIWMPGGTAILLSQFMQKQYGVLSRHCPAHKQVWHAIVKWWGAPTHPHEQEPFIAFFSEKQIFRHAPKIKDEDQGLDEPPWKTQLKAEATAAKKVEIPTSLPMCIVEALQDCFDWRVRMALRSRIRTEGDKWAWTPEQAEQDIKQVQSMLRKFTSESVEVQLRNMIRSNKPYLNNPQLYDSNLLSRQKADDYE